MKPTYWRNDTNEDGYVGLEGITFEETNPTAYWVILGHSGEWEDSYTFVVSVHSKEEEARSRVETFDAYHQDRQVTMYSHRDIHFYSVAGPYTNSSILTLGTNREIEDAYEETLYAEEDEPCEDVSQPFG